MKNSILVIIVFYCFYFTSTVILNCQTPRLALKKSFPERILVARITINDKLFVVGSKIYAITQPYDDTYQLKRNLYMYDIQSDTWTKIGEVPFKKLNFSAACVNGKIYCIGGTNSLGKTSTVDMYDPETNQWSVKRSMTTERDCAGSIALGDKIYLIGGGSLTDGKPSVEVYDTKNDQWTTLAEMPTNSPWTTVVESNGIIYAIGGYQGLFEAYDISSNKWSKKSNTLVPSGPLTAENVNGKIYLFSGDGGINMAAEYDPAADTWTQRTNVPAIGRDPNLCVLNNKVYLVGGVGSSNRLLSSVLCYDPIADSWQLAANMSKGKWMTGLAISQDKIYVLGGYTDSGAIDNALEVYDAVTSVFGSNIPLPTDFCLQQNFPNPFNPETVIGYQLPVACHVELKIYDMLGRETASLVNNAQSAGKYQVRFDGSNLSNGVYLYKLAADNFVQTNKMVLVK